MKRFVLLLICTLLFSTTGNQAFAHSGRTDSSGGHNCSPSSQAKKLCTGYHYHNGGSGSGGGNTTTTTTQSWDKDCTDFSSYDEVVRYWNSKGYTKYNDPERLDGFGNKVDDGIPCEASSGSDTSKIKGSPAYVEKKNAKQDKAKGQDNGYPKGLRDGETGKSKNTSTKGNKAYKQGYQIGYDKGYAKGKEKLNKLIKLANSAGEKQAEKQESLKISIPAKYEKIAPLKLAYKEGFEEVKQESFKVSGKRDGEKGIHTPPKNVNDDYIKAYEKGHKEGLELLRKQYEKQGYEDAFKMVDYKAPKLEKPEYIKWHKKGFTSNKAVVKIQKQAFNMGLNGEAFKVPSNFQHAEKVFSHHYGLGAEQRKKDNIQGASFWGLLLLGWLGRRFYVAKKMVG